MCYLHAPCTILQDTLTTSASFPRSTKVWSDLFGKLCAGCMVPMSRMYVGKDMHESTIASSPYLACPILSPACPPAHTKPLLTQGTRNLYHTLTLSAHRRWALTKARGIEDATLPLDLTPIREPESGAQDPWPLPIGDSAAARTSACTTAGQFCSSEACAASHPTCLIASSVLRSAFARSIRNPLFSSCSWRPARHAAKKCQAVESNAAACSSQYATAEACGNEARANPRLISALVALRRRILISFARPRPQRV